MKAIVITNISGKEVLQEQEVSVPKLNDDEVLIKVVAIAVNEPDVIEMEMLRNSLQPRKAFGLECSGIIEKVGSQVKTLKVNDEVCAILSGEGYAEKVCVPQGHVLPKPNNIPLSRVSKPFEKDLSCLKTDGRLISLGTCSLDTRDGFDTFPDTIQPDIPKIHWLSAASFWRRDQESKARMVAEVKEYVWPLIEAGNVCPVFPCRLFPFSEANEAYELMKYEMTSRNNIGKILLVPNSS